ncbi:MAG: hypothetical protein K0U72_11440 [Gammaproteobacteria bacterium]|nr:hypothetical protein [Gammaproteobacteria bacterium]
MRTTKMKLALISALMCMSFTAMAQSEPQVITIPLSNPGEPVSLDISIISAYIEVIGEDREDAEFEVRVEKGSRKIVTPSGTKELTTGAYSLEVDENDNHISVDTDWRMQKINIVARIPQRADLELSTTNNGEIVVSNITGSLQLENTNGPITARNIRGSVIAESVNRQVDVSFASIDPDSAMSFETINGDLILGLPEGAGAQLHIDTSRGEILSDFEVDIQPSKPIVERRNDRGGVEVRLESVIVANVNGGGPAIKLKTLHGDIHIKKSGD